MVANIWKLKQTRQPIQKSLERTMWMLGEEYPDNIDHPKKSSKPCDHRQRAPPTTEKTLRGEGGVQWIFTSHLPSAGARLDNRGIHGHFISH